MPARSTPPSCTQGSPNHRTKPACWTNSSQPPHAPRTAASALPAVPTHPSRSTCASWPRLDPCHADQGTADEQPDTIPIRAWLDAWAGFIAYSHPRRLPRPLRHRVRPPLRASRAHPGSHHHRLVPLADRLPAPPPSHTLGSPTSTASSAASSTPYPAATTTPRPALLRGLRAGLRRRPGPHHLCRLQPPPQPH